MSTRQTLLAAVQALYHHPDDNVKKQANAWLEAWQRSLDAWSTSDAVLHDSSSSIEAQYFCAITLRTKVCYLSLGLWCIALFHVYELLETKCMLQCENAIHVCVQLC